MKIAVYSCLLAVLSFSPLMSHAETLFDADTGYRLTQYRAPIPAPPDGVATVSLAELDQLAAEGAILVDVRPLRTFHIEPDGRWIIAEPNQSLPNAIWLPVVGWGIVDDWAEDYLRNSLMKLATPGQPVPEQTVIVFCQADCWLSWNAVQRVAALGYDARWYPNGVDGWTEQGRDLTPVFPVPAPDNPGTYGSP